MSNEIQHADIAGATFVGTISQTEMATLIRTLGSYIADAPEQPVRVDVTQFGTLQFRIGGGMSGCSVVITDSVVHLKGA